MTKFLTSPWWRHLQQTNCKLSWDIYHGGIRRKCLLQAFSIFLTMSSTAYFLKIIFKLWLCSKALKLPTNMTNKYNIHMSLLLPLYRVFWFWGSFRWLFQLIVLLFFLSILFFFIFFSPVISYQTKYTYLFLSHNNPSFQCNIAITNFLVLHTCEIRFRDIIDRTVHMFTSWSHPMQKFQNMAKRVCFWTPINHPARRQVPYQLDTLSTYSHCQTGLWPLIDNHRHLNIHWQ